jgi:nucleoside-triphosphatase THEP1
MGQKQELQRKITIISGKRDIGKTNLCMLLRKKIVQADKEVSGVISPGLYKGDQKIGILTEDIRSGKSRQIARFAPGWDPENPNREWDFNQKAVSWGNERLKGCVPSDYLIIDELGYLEFEENQGWTAGLQALDRGDFNHAIVVIRPDLVNLAQARWGNISVFTLTEGDDLEKLADKILPSSSLK